MPSRAPADTVLRVVVQARGVRGEVLDRARHPLRLLAELRGGVGDARRGLRHVLRAVRDLGGESRRLRGRRGEQGREVAQFVGHRDDGAREAADLAALPRGLRRVREVAGGHRLGDLREVAQLVADGGRDEEQRSRATRRAPRARPRARAGASRRRRRASGRACPGRRRSARRTRRPRSRRATTVTRSMTCDRNSPISARRCALVRPDVAARLV